MFRSLGRKVYASLFQLPEPMTVLAGAGTKNQAGIAGATERLPVALQADCHSALSRNSQQEAPGGRPRKQKSMAISCRTSARHQHQSENHLRRIRKRLIRAAVAAFRGTASADLRIGRIADSVPLNLPQGTGNPGADPARTHAWVACSPDATVLHGSRPGEIGLVPIHPANPTGNR